MTADAVTHEQQDRREEIASLRETVRDVCKNLGGTAATRRLSAKDTGYDEQAWDILGREVGIAALGLPEGAGGLGGLAELAAVSEVLGGVLLPVPFLSSDSRRPGAGPGRAGRGAAAGAGRRGRHRRAGPRRARRRVGPEGRTAHSACAGRRVAAGRRRAVRPRRRRGALVRGGRHDGRRT